MMLFVDFQHVLASAAAGSQVTTLRAEGLPFAWALLLLVLAIPVVVWSHRRFAAGAGKLRMNLLAAVRCLLIAVLLFLLTRPVLDHTSYHAVRQTLLVLIDASLSMEIADVRATPEDEHRAAIAFGELPPDAGLAGPAPSGSTPPNPTRAGILAALNNNERLSLWRKLRERADLVFYGFSRASFPLPAGTVGDSAAPLPVFDGEATAIGDALREVLDAHRGTSLAGVFLLTDGANNAGSPPELAAAAAKADGVPLYLYGVGVEQPRDLIMRSLAGPRLGFKGEQMEFTAKFYAGNMGARAATVTLWHGDQQVASTAVPLKADGEYEAALSFAPEEAGDMELTAKVEPMEGEAREDNNSASAPLRVIDDEIKVLYVEYKPRWDFRYLLATLQRDKRLKVSAWLFAGDPDLHLLENSPFLEKFPADRESLFSYQIVILGDVSPESLGQEWMELLQEWVGSVGGGVIFLAGMNYNPIAYADTPLADLLPILIDTNADPQQQRKRYPELRRLRLTTAGELSPYFQTSENPLENRRIWDSFPGVRWTAPAAGAKPGAEVIAVDPSPERAVPGGVPVIARQSYGSGETIFFGTDETYRWRSRVGETHYIRLWGQIMQAMSLQRLLGASQLVQLRADRPRYEVGDKVRISGRIYNTDFTPATAASIPGTLVRLQNEENPGAEPTVAEQSDLEVVAVPGRSGEFATEFSVITPGRYRYSTLQDPNAVVEFAVREFNMELLETGINAPLLQAMAAVSAGRFFREEDLHQLPALLEEREATVPRFERERIYLSPWWLLVLIFFMCGEWTARRLMSLK